MTIIPDTLRAYPIVHIDPLVSIHDAAGLMFSQEIGALVVIEGGCLVGIISERDLMNKVVLGQKVPEDTLVEGVMTRDVIVVTPDETLDKVLHLMSEHHIRHIPVVNEDKKPLYMLSFRDVYTYKLKQLQHENQALLTLSQLNISPVSAK